MYFSIVSYGKVSFGIVSYIRKVYHFLAISPGDVLHASVHRGFADPVSLFLRLIDGFGGIESVQASAVAEVHSVEVLPSSSLMHRNGTGDVNYPART